MAKSTNPFSQLVLNSRFNSQQIANRLVLDLIAPKMKILAEKVAITARVAADRVVDRFFRDLAVNFMGKSQPLSELLPRSLSDPLNGSVIDLRPWNPLSLKYVKHKKGGDTRFWIYTLSPGRVGYRYNQHAKHQGTPVISTPLIEYLAQQSGLAVFGSAKTTLVPSKTIELSSPGLPGRVIYNTGLRTPRNPIKDERIEVKIQLWTKIPNRRRFPDIDRFVALNFRGVQATFQGNSFTHFGSLALVKLVNARALNEARYRPLIRPFMAYYSQVVVPKEIQKALKKYQGARNLNITDNAKKKR